MKDDEIIMKKLEEEYMRYVVDEFPSPLQNFIETEVPHLVLSLVLQRTYAVAEGSAARSNGRGLYACRVDQ